MLVVRSAILTIVCNSVNTLYADSNDIVFSSQKTVHILSLCDNATTVLLIIPGGITKRSDIDCSCSKLSVEFIILINYTFNCIMKLVYLTFLVFLVSSCSL